VALILGTVFLQQDYDQKGALNMTAALYITITALAFTNQYSIIAVIRPLIKQVVFDMFLIDLLWGNSSVHERAQKWSIQLISILFR